MVSETFVGRVNPRRESGKPLNQISFGVFPIETFR